MSKTSPRYKMNTAAFLSIWRLNMDVKEGAWRKFVIMCFDKFQEDNDGYLDTYLGYEEWNPSRKDHNMVIVKSSDHTDDEKYQFLSEKAYAKCASLRSKMVKARQDLKGKINFPDGYLSRAGNRAKKSSKIQPSEMISILLG